MRISRDEARARIAATKVAGLSLEERKKIIGEWWSLDDTDDGWGELPTSLQNEISSSADATSDAMQPRYDPLLTVACKQENRGVLNSWLETALNVQEGETFEVEGTPELMVACRCCGYLSLSQRGVYEICPVCFWEDDGLQDLDRVSGPNHMTLREAKKNFVRLGTCSKDAIDHVLPDGPSRYPRSN